MTERKARLTVTVDKALLQAGADAVAAGAAESLSAWVNRALGDRVDKEARLLAMAGALARYEQQHGAITSDELAAQERTDRRSAIVVRGRTGVGRRRKRPATAA